MEKILIKIWSVLKPYKVKFALIIACSVLSMLMSFFQPLITRNITDKGLLKLDYRVIAISTMLLIFTILCIQILEIAQSRNLLSLKIKLQHELHKDGFEKLLRLKIDYFINRNSAGIINELNTDINCTSILVDKGIIHIFNYVLRVITGLAGLFYINWKMALCIIICIPVKIYFIYLFSDKKEKLTDKYIKENQIFNSWMADRIAGIKEIKLLNRNFKEISAFSFKKKDILECERKLDMIELYNNSIGTIIEGIVIAIFYFIGGYFVCREKITLGSLLAFISYSGNVTGPITILINIKMIVAQVRPSFSRLQEFFNLEEEKNSPISSVMPPNKILIDRVDFRYNQRKILSDVSFEMKKGEKIAIIGENGSGKSTLLHLLLRLYEPESGKILVDGIDATEIDLAIYRSFFSVVTQSPYLFQETIRENVDSFGNYSEQEILETFSLLGMTELLKHLSDGINTKIGVESANLSGGEKQKIAIIRAVLKKSPILILDEGTANFDQESEEWLFSEGLKLFKDKIVLLITHQLQYLNKFDKVYELKDGNLDEVKMALVK
ncbi:ABC transporter ATP-binding protein/permease [Blautia schinkii]|nr:ABC transporter ATP-binding protein/permease [Blautia schinkii]